MNLTTDYFLCRAFRTTNENPEHILGAHFSKGAAYIWLCISVQTYPANKVQINKVIRKERGRERSKFEGKSRLEIAGHGMSFLSSLTIFDHTVVNMEA